MDNIQDTNITTQRLDQIESDIEVLYKSLLPRDRQHTLPDGRLLMAVKDPAGNPVAAGLEINSVYLHPDNDEQEINIYNRDDKEPVMTISIIYGQDNIYGSINLPGDSTPRRQFQFKR